MLANVRGGRFSSLKPAVTRNAVILINCVRGLIKIRLSEITHNVFSITTISVHPNSAKAEEGAVSAFPVSYPHKTLTRINLPRTL